MSRPFIANIAGGLLFLARRLLYAWVRTRVFPTVAELGLDPAVPVCYVIQDRRLTNVLVLAEETRRAGLPPADLALAAGPLQADRSFFCLTRAQVPLSTAKERYAHSPLLTGMTAAVRGGGLADVQIVPVTILWGRAPQNQDSILKALFAEAWRPPSHFRQLAAVLLHGRQVLVRFGAPISLAGLVRDEEEGRGLRKVLRVLRVHFRRQREMAIGPDLSHRNTQVERLLDSPAVGAAIEREMAAKDIDAEAARKKARGFALEIASDYSYGVIRALELFLTWLWTRLYDGVAVHHFEPVLEMASGHGIVYVPCHRSHIDYLLLSYVIFKRGLTPPHIAAGANLNLPVVGPILRRGGAFFLRRSFKDEPLYAAVFNEYLHLMISRGFSIEYFIEGTRSRSGRTLPPRTGILGMTVKSYLRGHERPLVFVPVYVGYEKLIEGQSFLGELAGRPKQRESLWNLLGVWRQLKRDFGQVHVNFGRPLPMSEFLDQVRPGWSQSLADPEAAWVREATTEAAAELVRRINEAAVVTPINLAALALLATPRHAADEATALRLIGHYQALLRDAPYGPQVVTCELPAAEVIAYARKLGVVERLPHPLGELLRVPESEAALLAYFRNNVLHLVALPGLVACLLAQNPRLERGRVEAAVDRMHALARSELFLRYQLDDVRGALDKVVAVLVARGLLTVRGEELLAPEPNSIEFAELQLLGQTMRPTLERVLLTLAVLQQHGTGRLSRRKLEDSCHLLAQRLALLYEFNSPEFSDKGLFAGVVANLIAAGLLREDETGLLHFDERITAPAADAELLLAAEVRQTIRRMAKVDTAGEAVAATSA